MMLSPRVALDALAEILLMTLLTAISVLLRTIFEAARGGMDGGASRLHLAACRAVKFQPLIDLTTASGGGNKLPLQSAAYPRASIHDTNSGRFVTTLEP